MIPSFLILICTVHSFPLALRLLFDSVIDSLLGCGSGRVRVWTSLIRLNDGRNGVSHISFLEGAEGVVASLMGAVRSICKLWWRSRHHVSLGI